MIVKKKNIYSVQNRKQRRLSYIHERKFTVVSSLPVATNHSLVFVSVHQIKEKQKEKKFNY